MPRALLSVSDKRGIVEFARGLTVLGFEILSTGGTRCALLDAGIECLDVAEMTGVPEMLDGRVKTLSPMVHGALLGDTTNPEHVRQMSAMGIAPIEVLAVNLYPFEATVTRDHEWDEAIENIDIGGPAMIRAAAKNARNVTVVVDPDDYERVLDTIASGDLVGLWRGLQAKAFRHTAYYDSVIARYLGGDVGLTETATLGLRLRSELRYGENPHQRGAWYVDALGAPGIGSCRVLGGKEPSYNNVLDADAAWELVADLPAGACAIVKHGNPCGAAAHADLAEAYRRAKASDPVSAFGGIVAFNRPVDLATAEAMTEKGNFLEVVIAPGWEPEARAAFEYRGGWGANTRLIEADLPGGRADWTWRTIRGGALVQSADEEPESEWRVVSAHAPMESQWADLRFAWTVARHVRSNAIVVAADARALGVGAGQMNRVQSTRLALEQAGEGAKGAALASDGFFPFADSIEAAASAGVATVVSPGGSKNDEQVIAAADRLGVVLVFTGIRHFRH